MRGARERLRSTQTYKDGLVRASAQAYDIASAAAPGLVGKAGVRLYAMKQMKLFQQTKLKKKGGYIILPFK